MADMLRPRSTARREVEEAVRAQDARVQELRSEAPVSAGRLSPYETGASAILHHASAVLLRRAEDLCGHPLCDACGLLLLPRGGGAQFRRCDCCGLVVPAAAQRKASDAWDVSKPYEHAALSKARMQMCDGCGYLVLERRVWEAMRKSVQAAMGRCGHCGALVLLGGGQHRHAHVPRGLGERAGATAATYNSRGLLDDLTAAALTARRLAAGAGAGSGGGRVPGRPSPPGLVNAHSLLLDESHVTPLEKPRAAKLGGGGDKLGERIAAARALLDDAAAGRPAMNEAISAAAAARATATAAAAVASSGSSAHASPAHTRLIGGGGDGGAAAASRGQVVTLTATVDGGGLMTFVDSDGVAHKIVVPDGLRKGDEFAYTLRPPTAAQLETAAVARAAADLEAAAATRAAAEAAAAAADARAAAEMEALSVDEASGGSDNLEALESRTSSRLSRLRRLEMGEGDDDGSQEEDEEVVEEVVVEAVEGSAARGRRQEKQVFSVLDRQTSAGGGELLHLRRAPPPLGRRPSGERLRRRAGGAAGEFHGGGDELAGYDGFAAGGGDGGGVGGIGWAEMEQLAAETSAAAAKLDAFDVLGDDLGGRPSAVEQLAVERSAAAAEAAAAGKWVESAEAAAAADAEAAVAKAEAAAVAKAEAAARLGRKGDILSKYSALHAGGASPPQASAHAALDAALHEATVAHSRGAAASGRGTAPAAGRRATAAASAEELKRQLFAAVEAGTTAPPPS